jgi:polyisoprenoid-binding protein YceI
VSDRDETAADASPGRSRRRWILWISIGVVAVVALFFAGIFVYANFINDAPDALDETDLSNALVATTPAPDATAADPAAPDGTDSPASTPDSSTPDSSTPDGSAPAVDYDGDWVPTAASEFGYRVEEVLAGVNTTAVGRGNEIIGVLTIEGTTATVVDVMVRIESITSDDARRDGQFTGRIMNAADFPTAEFRTTEPIDFGRIPVGDEQITATATGVLTLRGVSNPVEFDVTAQTTDGRIGVLGSIPVAFADYGIDNPSFGAIKTEDDGLVEFVLVFEPA